MFPLIRHPDPASAIRLPGYFRASLDTRDLPSPSPLRHSALALPPFLFSTVEVSRAPKLQRAALCSRAWRAAACFPSSDGSPPAPHGACSA